MKKHEVGRYLDLNQACGAERVNGCKGRGELHVYPRIVCMAVFPYQRDWTGIVDPRWGQHSLIGRLLAFVLS